jgi:hypothetical protein
MSDYLLPPEMDKPAPPIMRLWKWIGLALLLLAILMRQWLPGPAVGLACLCGLIVIFNLFFHLLRRIKNRVFWKARNRILGSFVFVGLIPLLALAGVIYLSARVFLGQLSGNFVEVSLKEMLHELSWINAELGQKIQRGVPLNSLDPIASATFASHAARFSRLAARLARKRPDGAFEIVWKSDPQGIFPKIEQYPAEKWLGSKPFFEGLLGGKQTMFMTSLRAVPQLPGHYLDLSATRVIFRPFCCSMAQSGGWRQAV